MAKHLHTIMKEFLGSSGPLLFWIDGKASWATGSALIIGDHNLEIYLGSHILNELYKNMSRIGNYKKYLSSYPTHTLVGFRELEISQGHIYIGDKLNLRGDTSIPIDSYITYLDRMVSKKIDRIPLTLENTRSYEDVGGLEHYRFIALPEHNESLKDAFVRKSIINYLTDRIKPSQIMKFSLDKLFTQGIFIEIDNNIKAVVQSTPRARFIDFSN